MPKNAGVVVYPLQWLFLIQDQTMVSWFAGVSLPTEHQGSLYIFFSFKKLLLFSIWNMLFQIYCEFLVVYRGRTKNQYYVHNMFPPDARRFLWIFTVFSSQYIPQKCSTDILFWVFLFGCLRWFGNFKVY